MTKPAPTQSLDDLLGVETEFHAPAVVDEPTEEVEGSEPDPKTNEDIEIAVTQYVARVEKGRRGRPKGSIVPRKAATKSSVTQQRLALEAGIRDYMEHPNRRLLLRDALDRLLRTAAYSSDDNHATRAMGVLFEKLVSSAKQEEEAAGNAPPQIHIVIENATARPVKAIEAEFTEVKGTL
jgi:hypothetical protein